MALECFDGIMEIAVDRELPRYEEMKKLEIREYLGQIMELLRIVYLSTKELEDDGPATISKIIPTILNALLEIEDPEVSNFQPLMY
jgi:hypothetical protein